jgi:uncharacterized protein YdaU (DUF1376 family)
MKLPDLTVDVCFEESDTNLLDAEELGMYQRLLWQAWRETPPCSLPDDDAYLARVARVPASRFMERKNVVMRPFTIGADKRWHHPRIKVLFDRARARAKAYQSNARHRWEESKRKETESDATALQRHKNGIATGIQEQCSPLSINLLVSGEGGLGEGLAMPPLCNGIALAEKVGIWEGVFSQTMNIHNQEKLDLLLVTDAGVWQETLEAWETNGYSARNLAGQFDSYKRRQERAKKELAAAQKAKILQMPHTPNAASCSTCFGDGYIPNPDLTARKIKRMVDCPACTTQTKSA